jgi:hypothetical protein
MRIVFRQVFRRLRPSIAVADLVLADIERAMASLARDYKRVASRHRDPTISSIVSDGESGHGLCETGLAPHIRGLLPTSGLIRKGTRRRAGENSREPHAF